MATRYAIDCVDYPTAVALAAKIDAKCGYPIRGKLADWVSGGVGVPADTVSGCRILFRADTKTYAVVTTDDPLTQAQIQALGMPLPDTKLDAGDQAKVVAINEGTWVKVAPDAVQVAEAKVG